MILQLFGFFTACSILGILSIALVIMGFYGGDGLAAVNRRDLWWYIPLLMAMIALWLLLFDQAPFAIVMEG